MRKSEKQVELDHCLYSGCGKVLRGSCFSGLHLYIKRKELLKRWGAIDMGDQ